MFKNVLLASALGLSIYALATGAEAGHRPAGWYVAVEGGANWLDDADVFRNGAPLAEAEFESGWAVFVEVGHRWNNNWRLELEAGWRENDVDCVNFGGGCMANPANGDISQFSQMINVVHDIDLTQRTALSVGIGLGGAFVDSSAAGLRDDDDYVFAGQALVQLTHELTNRLDFVITYRYMTADSPDFRTLVGNNLIEFDNESHTLTVGLRFDLHADAAPMMQQPVTTMPAPPPPPSEPKQFIVYFGFNKANLDRRAMDVVREAAATAMRVGYVSILVTGHTDTVGSNAYNNRLSLRRARNVTKALVGEGIPARGITSTGRGETELMVQTGDREIEPRNRRATIDLN